MNRRSRGGPPAGHSTAPEGLPPLIRWTAYFLIWIGVGWLTLALHQEAGRIHPELEWVAVLHPVVFGLTAWPVARAAASGRRWFRIQYGVLLMTYVWMGLGSAYYIFHFSELPYASLKVPDVALEAMAAVVLGVLVFRVTVSSRPVQFFSRLFPDPPRTPPWSTALRIGVWSVLAATLAVTIYLINSGGYVYQSRPEVGGLLSLLQFFQRAGLVALSVGYYYWFRRTPTFHGFDKVVLMLSTGILGALALVSGMKKELLYIILHIVVPYLVLRWSSGRFVTVPRGFVLGGMLFVVTLFAVTPVYRTILRGTDSGASRLSTSITAGTTTIDIVAREPELVGGLVSAGLLNLWSRTAMYSNLIPVVDQTPRSVPYRGFESFVSLPATALIPRFVWPGKPTNTLAADFQRTYVSGEKIFANLPSTFGTGYMRGGMVGVAVVFAILGVLGGMVDRYSLENGKGELLAVLVFTVGFRLLVNVENDMYWRLNGIPKIAGVLLITYLAVTGWHYFGSSFSKQRSEKDQMISSST